MGFKENLKYFRKKAGLSASEAAQKLNIPFNTYRNYEGTQGSEPSYSDLIRIANLLHVTTDQLLGNVNDGDNLILCAKDALTYTDYSIVDFDEDSVYIKIKDQKEIFPFQRSLFMANVQREMINTEGYYLQLLGEHLALSLRALIFARMGIDKIDQSGAASLFSMIRIKIGHLTPPIMDLTKKENKPK